MAMNPFVVLVIAVLLLSIFLYLAGRFVLGKKDLDIGYIFRILIIAIIAVVAIPALLSATSVLNEVDISGTSLYELTGIAQMVPIIVFICLVYLIKFLLIPEKDEITKWSGSVWVAFLTMLFISFLNAILIFTFGSDASIFTIF